MADVLTFEDCPENYKPPSYTEVSNLHSMLKVARQPAIDRIWEVKRVRRGEWTQVVRKIPKAWRKMLLDPDLPQVRDMLNRVAGLISKHDPVYEVQPPSPKIADIRKASGEEARIQALRKAVQDQQDRDVYAMGIDAQASWGESWILVMPDMRRMKTEMGERGEKESAGEYSERFRKSMLQYGIPLLMDDIDPLSVFPQAADNGRMAISTLETQHKLYDIEIGLGYSPVTNADGKVVSWLKRGHFLGEGMPTSGVGNASGVRTDPNHAVDPEGKTNEPHGGVVTKLIYLDCWTYQCYLDGILVEEWRHNFGYLPLFPAAGEQNSDRDPAWSNAGIADAAITIGKQLVFYSAVMASSSLQHGFPTPFLRNPVHSITNPATGSKATRPIAFGEMNVLGPGEAIEFPFLNAKMGPDFFRHMEFLTEQLESASLSNFGKAVGTNIAGYAIAQIRAMQQSVLGMIYKNAQRQWRKIAYFLRFLVKKVFPGGLWLRGALTADPESGEQYRPILRFAEDDVTDFTIECHIPEGIPQDEMAEEKMALEKMAAGVWSRRRTMEKTGVEDPALETEEIAQERLTSSPEFDQQVLALAMQMAKLKVEADQQEQSSPFYQAVEKAKRGFAGGGGQFQNQGGAPVNAAPGGQPVQQAPTAGGAGPEMAALGAPTTPQSPQRQPVLA